ncbi:MAG: EAL domain-containing protein [Planctomycetota bacterium]
MFRGRRVVFGGRWVVFSPTREVRATGGRHAKCALKNLSADHILRELDLDARCVKLEITESVLMDNSMSASAMLEQLHALGTLLGLDDFGTGYSSLSYLHLFPFDTLKIDRSFVNRIGKAGENTEIVRTIVMLAHNLGLTVIAEGVENQEHLTHLRSLGCEYGQGYLFSEPVDHEAAEALIAAEPKW